MRVFWVRRNLAFGSAIATWRDVEALQELGVTHVINLQRNKHTKKIRKFKSLWLPFRDDKKPRPKWFYRAALKFHRRAASDKSSKLLVMCHHGRCRSASLTYFLLRTTGVAAATAEAKVRKARTNAVLPRAYRDSCERFLERIA